ncbi:MAG: protein kinase domain-containing protein [Pseudonocardiaceae bacterium]
MSSAAEPAPTRRDAIMRGTGTHPDRLGSVPTWRDPPSIATATRRDLPPLAAVTLRDAVEPQTSTTDPRLPAELAARFRVVGALPQHGAEADVVWVRDTAGQDVVIKLYRPEISPDPHVWRALPQLRTANLVRVHETGQAGGRSYEVMEYLPGGNLRALTGQPLDTTTIIEVIRQVSAGLAALHAANITHRDIKPENVLLRAEDPREFVLTDFGLSRHLEQSMIFSTAARTLIYTAPETFYDHVSFARDWWSLGVIVHELATGKRPFEGLSEHPIMMQLSRHAFPVDDVPDPRLRLLCRGLLVHDFESRWGLAQVRAWLDGQSPAVPQNRGPADQPAGNARPFLFLGEHYTEPRELGLAMAQNWAKAARLHFARLGEHWNDLSRWLGQFDDPDRFDVAGRREMVDELSEPGPADAKLLRLLAWLNPSLPPTYRGLSLAPRHIVAVAMAAANGDPKSATAVDDLWCHELLPVLARFAGARPLAELDVRWRALLADFDRVAGQLAEDAPQVAERLSDPAALKWARAVLLAQAATSQNVTVGLADQVRHTRRRLPVPVPWFVSYFRHMGHAPQRVVVGQLISAVAVAEAEQTVREREVTARQPATRRAQWYQQERHRIAGRTEAIGWALGGIAILLIPWLIYLAIVPSPTAGLLGLLTILVATAAEVLLAWRLGRSYSPDHALLWQLRTVLLRAGAILQLKASGKALWFAAAGGTALVILSSTAPLAVPLTVMGAHLVWVGRRWQAWTRVHARAEREALDRR